MLATLNKIQPVALLFLRVAVGIIMVVHGWWKIGHMEGFGQFLAGLGFTQPSPQFHVYMAIACEFLGGLGILVGLLTRVAALGIASAMSVAVFFVHWNNGLLMDNPATEAFENGYEYPLTLLAVAVFLIFNGAGPLSLDALICKCKNKCHKEVSTEL